MKYIKLSISLISLCLLFIESTYSQDETLNTLSIKDEINFKPISNPSGFYNTALKFRRSNNELDYSIEHDNHSLVMGVYGDNEGPSNSNRIVFNKYAKLVQIRSNGISLEGGHYLNLRSVKDINVNGGDYLNLRSVKDINMVSERGNLILDANIGGINFKSGYGSFRFFSPGGNMIYETTNGNVNFTSETGSFKMKAKNIELGAPVKGGNTDGTLRVQSGHGWADIGAKNTGWLHIYTDRPKIILNKPIYSHNGVFSAYNTSNLSLQTNGTTRMTILKSNGNVGIGTNDPSSKLTVEGDAKFNGDIDVKRQIRILPNDPGTIGPQHSRNDFHSEIVFENRSQPIYSIGFGVEPSRPGSGALNIGAKNFLFDPEISGVSIDRNQMTLQGNSINFSSPGVTVGIGITDTQGYQLGVKGKIATEEIKVALESDWPDYVFDDAYQLLSLTALEEHINKTGHLPNIPSAKEIIANKGFELGEMNRKLLEKIEELTLYTIEQEKKIVKLRELQKINTQLKKKISTQELRLKKIEELVAHMQKSYSLSSKN